MSILITLLKLFYIFCCIITIIAILLQQERSSDITSVFGGGTSNDTLFGTKTASVLARFTVIMSIILFVLIIILGRLTVIRHTVVTPQSSNNVSTTSEQK